MEKTLDNAKEEAERLAEQMKKSAEQIHKGWQFWAIFI